MSSRRTTLGLWLAAGLLLAVSGWLLMDNPTVDIAAADVGGHGPAGAVGCSIAPYDAGFYGNDDPPGGEHSTAYADEVAASCYAANLTRFRLAGAAGVGALVLAVAAVVSLARPRPDRRR